MRGLSYHQKPRTLGAQRDRMARRWPDFKFRMFSKSLVGWDGQIRGAQKWYLVRVLWLVDGSYKPYVIILDPPLRPRNGGTFDQIPHLLYDSDDPAASGLCLFDPDGAEWSNRLLLADTTMWWAAEWLLFYELWHLTGEWRGGGVGYESIAEARAASLYRQASPLAEGEAQATPVAEG
ncbi:hypothetical protein QCM80_34340 [Bradyrhizobium sp. SSUT112]|uniref:hypothetical protein n=1 Tax=Bradyrhizobium sp. SSUT112 TaxID=3040604 RepID=UPI00244B8327|nr:hypothetical protein [Bradyrhizobium sp. SSUT112]MDH2355715.1 hypothetical protein [Bradyrhizobium sp. SSUT112]